MWTCRWVCRSLYFILLHFILFYFCATPCACVISLAPKVVPGSSDIQRYNKPPAESKIQIRVRLHPHWIIAIGWAPHAGTWPFILGFFGHTPSIHIYYIWTLYTYPDTDMFISAYMLMPGMSAWLLIYTVCRSADFAACWWVFVSFRFVLRLPVGNLVFNIKGVGMGKKYEKNETHTNNDGMIYARIRGQDSDKSSTKSARRFMARHSKAESRQWNGNLSPRNKLKTTQGPEQKRYFRIFVVKYPWFHLFVSIVLRRNRAAKFLKCFYRKDFDYSPNTCWYI